MSQGSGRTAFLLLVQGQDWPSASPTGFPLPSACGPFITSKASDGALVLVWCFLSDHFCILRSPVQDSGIDLGPWGKPRIISPSPDP